MRKRFSLLILFLCGLAVLAPAFSGTAQALSRQEEEKIEILLQALAGQSETVFIRNGSEHNAGEAATHLRRKLNQTRRRLATAEEFIDKVASSSSITGQPYLIRQPGQPEEPAGPYLRRLLQEALKLRGPEGS